MLKLSFVAPWCALFVVAVATFNLSTASAAIVMPRGSVSGVSGDVFTWNQDATHSTSAFWDTFRGYDGAPDPGMFGFLPAGTSPTANTTFSNGGSDNSLTFNSNASIVSSGNAYGGTFNPVDSPAVAATFVTDAFSTVRSGTTGGDFTRIVAQWQTLGSELDYSSILLNTGVAGSSPIAPSLAIETARGLSGNPRGGGLVSYLAVWDLDSSQTSYQVDFQASESAMSLDQFRVDSFTQSIAFVTPTAVPEPGSVAFVAGCCAAAAFRRKRNR